ncbi:MAG: hypothetical protein WCH83_15600, partial [Alphaproteobacteria bacterium]
MSFGVVWSPLVPFFVLIIAALAALALAVLLIVSRTRGTWWRIAAMALALLAMGNPVFTQEDRDPLRTVVAVVIDKSASQSLADRARITEEAR